MARQLDAIQPWTTWQSSSWFQRLLWESSSWFQHFPQSYDNCVARKEWLKGDMQLKQALSTQLGTFTLILKSACWHLEMRMLRLVAQYLPCTALRRANCCLSSGEDKDVACSFCLAVCLDAAYLLHERMLA